MRSSHGADHRFPRMPQFEMVTVSKPLIFPVMPYLQDALPLMQSAGIPQVVCSWVISPFSTYVQLYYVFQTEYVLFTS